MEDGSLNPREEKLFEDITRGLRKDDSEGVFRGRLTDGEQRRRDKRADIRRTVGKLAGSTGIVVAAMYIGIVLGRGHEPTVAEVRAAAFKDVHALRATGTCAIELDAEEKRLETMPNRDSSVDVKVHPGKAAYEQAEKLAQDNDIPCRPTSGQLAVSLMVVKGISVIVTDSGSMQFIATERPVVPILDYGSDVADVCVIGTSDGSGYNQQYADAAKQLRAIADVYCAPPPVLNPTAPQGVPPSHNK
jgi:hypothetical protein